MKIKTVKLGEMTVKEVLELFKKTPVQSLDYSALKELAQTSELIYYISQLECYVKLQTKNGKVVWE